MTLAWTRLTAVALALTLLAGTARADLITHTYDFTASDFTDSPPVDPVTGSVTVTWDPTINVFNDTSGITLNSLNIPLDSAIAYNYNVAESILTIGGVSSSVNGTLEGTNDFLAVIQQATTSPFINTVHYTEAGDDLFHISFTASVTSDVPEPATLLLFGSAAAGVAAIRRRRLVST